MSMTQLTAAIMGMSNIRVIAGVLFIVVLFIIIKRRRSKASQ
jgi:hypothetical protein